MYICPRFPGKYHGNFRQSRYLSKFVLSAECRVPTHLYRCKFAAWLETKEAIPSIHKLVYVSSYILTINIYIYIYIIVHELWNSYHRDVPLPSGDAGEWRSPNNTHLSIRAYSYDSTEYSSNIKIVDEKFDSRKYVRQRRPRVSGGAAGGEGSDDDDEPAPPRPSYG